MSRTSTVSADREKHADTAVAAPVRRRLAVSAAVGRAGSPAAAAAGPVSGVPRAACMSRTARRGGTPAAGPCRSARRTTRRSRRCRPRSGPARARSGPAARGRCGSAPARARARRSWRPTSAWSSPASPVASLEPAGDVGLGALDVGAQLGRLVGELRRAPRPARPRSSGAHRAGPEGRPPPKRAVAVISASLGCCRRDLMLESGQSPEDKWQSLARLQTHRPLQPSRTNADPPDIPRGGRAAVAGT